MIYKTKLDLKLYHFGLEYIQNKNKDIYIHDLYITCLVVCLLGLCKDLC